MVEHAAIAAVPVAGTPDRSLLQNALVNRFPYFLDTTEDPTAFDPTNAGGAVVKVISYKGTLFTYDTLDTTTAHDGVSTLVTLNGERYKIEGVDFLVRRVLDKDLTAPPGSPTIGDTYIVGTASTGAWATHDDEIAIYTARGWEFIIVGAGWVVQVADEDKLYRFNEAGAWILALDPQTSSIIASMLNGGRTHWVIENQTTNTPPVAGQGVAFIVGDTPTDAWVGHSGKIAVRETSGSNDVYAIYPPGEGWKAYDKAQNNDFTYDGSVWASSAGALIDWSYVFTEGTGTSTTGGSGNYAYSSSTAPVSGGGENLYRDDDVTISFTAKSAGNKLKFTYSAHMTGVGLDLPVIALFRDSETNAVAWEMETHGTDGSQMSLDFDAVIDAGDTNEHTWQIRIISTENETLGSIDRRLFVIEELVP